MIARCVTLQKFDIVISLFLSKGHFKCQDNNQNPELWPGKLLLNKCKVKQLYKKKTCEIQHILQNKMNMHKYV
jgi:hypothetical protein